MFERVSWRLVATVVTSADVFVLTYLPAWVGHAQTVALGDSYTSRSVELRLDRLSRTLSDFAERHGKYPDSLAELTNYDPPLDPWMRPFHYEKTENGFRIYSLGRDGQPGGVGLDADFEYDPQSTVRFEPTFAQFVFGGKGSGTLFKVALVASSFAGMTCYLAGRLAMALVVATGFIIVVAVFIAIFLVACYLGVFGSGH